MTSVNWSRPFSHGRESSGSHALRAGSAVALVAILASANSALAQSEPDLVVSDINFSSTPTPGVPTLATATLRNAGTWSSGPFNIKWFVDGVQVGYGAHASLPAGQISTGNVKFTWTPTSSDQVLRYDADVDGNVVEESEANNSYQVRVRNGLKVPLADLFAYGVQYGTFRVGEPGTAKATLRNVGTVSTGVFNIKWFVDGVQKGYGEHANLLPGAISNDNVTFYWTPTTAGWQVLRFVADVGQDVLESNETNNFIEATVLVQASRPDLLVDAISFSSPPTVGEATIATARLRNVGSSATGDTFNIKWFLDGAQVGYGLHNALGAGQTSTHNVYFNWTPASAGNHTLRYVADVDGDITESNETNNAFDVPVAVLAPDLVVNSILFPAPPTLNQPTVFEAYLRNLGPVATGEFNIKWFLDGVEVGYVRHAALGAWQRSTDNVYFNWTPTSPGTHSLRYVADVDGEVAEDDETNNAHQISISVRGPDLVVNSILFPSPPTVGQPTVFQAFLRNLGWAASGEFNIKWFLDGVEVGYGRHAALGAWEASSGNVYFTWTPTNIGTHTLRYVADVDGEVAEDDETNNAHMITITPRQADLFVDDISFSSLPLMAGQPTIATARLSNIGTGASGPFNVKWLVDGSQAGYGQHVPLAPGATSSHNVHLQWTPSISGIHAVRYEADVDGHVNEQNETNNAFEVTVKVGPLAELVVDQITFSTTPISGLPTVATARLRNVGPVASTAFNVKWFVDGVEVAYGAHTPLDPGQTATNNVQFTWTPPSAGLHRLRFSADVGDHVVEFDETNNSHEVAVDVARNPVELTFSPSHTLGKNADGWYSPNPVTLEVTLTCPAAFPSCSGFFRLATVPGAGAPRLSLYGNDPGAAGDVSCSDAPVGTEFSHGSWSSACYGLGGDPIEIASGQSRTLRWRVWMQPSDAASLAASAVWGGFSGAATLSVPKAEIHPLVFIHGILGAMPPQDKLVTSQGDAHQIFDPFIGSYEPLLNNLQKMGYEWDRSLFGLAYDWRNSNVRSAAFLAQELASKVIPRSNAASVPYTLKDGRADLVVHSMGGLVSRAYIEGKARVSGPPDEREVPYQDDVRKVVFIASPHKGFPFNYRTREGMTWKDYLYAAPGVSGGIFGTMTMVMDGILWPGLVAKKFEPSDVELDRDCIWVPLVGQDPPGLVPYQLFFHRIRNGQLGYFRCTVEDITPWAKERGARSLFEMLPTDDSPAYLTNLDGDPAGRPASFPWGHDANTFLHDLNADAHLLVSRLGDPAIPDNLYIIYGSGAPETDAYYEVKPPGLKDWQFGQVNQFLQLPDPTLHETDKGDDLIPAHSARMDGVLTLPPSQVRMLDARPAGGTIDGGARHVPIAYHRQTQSTWVPQFLTGMIFPIATAYTAPIVQGDNLLAVISACPINLLVIDPQGRKLGFDPATGQVVREIPNAVYTQPGVEPQMILIGQALPGPYQFTATGYDTGAYSFTVARVGPQGPVPLALFNGETTADQQQQHSFALDPNTPPGAVPDRYIVRPGQQFAVGGPGVLANDIELDGEAMTASLVSGPAHGQLTLDPDGSFTYTPDPAFPGTDSFVYRASDGLIDSNQATVSLSVRPPEVAVSPNQTANEGQMLAFSGSFNDDYPPADHTLAWDFGDGTGTTGTLTPSHAFADNGVYTVTLRVTSPAGLTGRASLQVTVANVPPVVEAGPGQSVNQGQPVTFAGSFSDAGLSDTHAVHWDFGDGGSADGSVAPTYVYAIPGAYLASLTVQDDDGEGATDSLTVTVANVAPVVQAGPDITASPTQVINFDGSFSDPGAEDTHTILWDFGDGTTETGTLQPTHSYPDFGIYSVTLTVTDNWGGASSDTLIATVTCDEAFVETFEPYGPDADPEGWVDYQPTGNHFRAREGFRTSLEGDHVVYRGNDDRVSEYRTPVALDWRDYEWTGSLMLGGNGHDAAGHDGAGLLVYADLLAGRYYQVSYDRAHKAHGFRALESGRESLAGRTRSGFVPKPETLYRFRLRVENHAGYTRLRARFWPEDAEEPTGWAIDARDDDKPLRNGTIGLLALDDHADFDDLRVEGLGDSSGITGDRDGDRICDNTDNCPAAPNPDQADQDHDGTGDACDRCSAAFAREQLCLDAGFDPASGLSAAVVDLVGDVTHLDGDGHCGVRGFYRLRNEAGLVFHTPALPERSHYRLRFLVRSAHVAADDGGPRSRSLAVEAGGRALEVPLTPEHPTQGWWWTRPITVQLEAGIHPVAVRPGDRGYVDLEAVEVEEVCAEESEPAPARS